MALYRFLFAPALLALAVLAGPGREQGPVTQAEPPRVVAPERAAAAPAPQAQGSLSRAVAKHAPRNPARPARR